MWGGSSGRWWSGSSGKGGVVAQARVESQLGPGWRGSSGQDGVAAQAGVERQLCQGGVASLARAEWQPRPARSGR